MQHRSLFVFDIETVPDVTAARTLTGCDSADPAELRAALFGHFVAQKRKTDPNATEADIFLRQPFWKVVAISFLEADILRPDGPGGAEQYVLKRVASGTKDDEADIVRGFFHMLEQKLPRLVSYNGRTFDLPVLRYRGMKYGVSAPKYYRAGDKWNSYTQRYADDWHCDLLEVLSDYGASARCKMDEVCSVLGLPGKFGVDGSKVSEMYENGQVQAIRDYCETDVINTYLVYLRHMLMTGRLDEAAHDQAVADLITYIENEQDTRPHLMAFLAAWDDACQSRFYLSDYKKTA
jgi:predicted PolB exonuclease-like 3'-5' exonuclease